ncbi:hypothetical protein DKX38_001362 [Salix brachista]|uniref:Signal peptidase complex catalytic subunit SEC11 n=1 Tax=Salix brachista TaxID=2182728 RepID=A0A5N5P4K3_9ROSI|nr:hypothetical protein DKX38_001362 [Salix brachista]
MGWIGETVDSIKSIQIRQLLTQAVSLGMIVTSALIIWKALMCITGSESPVVVVLSGSMEPGFKRVKNKQWQHETTLCKWLGDCRSDASTKYLQHEALLSALTVLLGFSDDNTGDILFLHMSKDPIRAGEIVVFNIDGREIPIVHRVIKVKIWLTLLHIQFNAMMISKTTLDKLAGLGGMCPLFAHQLNTPHVHERQDTGEVDVLTKGDNNYGDDRLLYAQGQLWLQRHHIMGRAVGFLPYVGWVTIIMTEKPIIKVQLLLYSYRRVGIACHNFKGLMVETKFKSSNVVVSTHCPGFSLNI